MSFTGNFLDAHEAFAWGLVNHVVAHDELMPFCRRLAADIIGNDQRGVRQIRKTYDAVARAPSATDGRSSGVTHATGSARDSIRPKSSVAAWRSSNAAAPRPDASFTRRWRRRAARYQSRRTTRCSARVPPSAAAGPTRACRRRASRPRRTVGAALCEHRALNRPPDERDIGERCRVDEQIRSDPAVIVAVVTSTSTAYARSPPIAPSPRRWPMVTSSTASTSPTWAPVRSTTRPGRSGMRSPKNARRPSAFVMKHTSWLSGLAAVRRPSVDARARTSRLSSSPTGSSTRRSCP